MTNMDNKVGGLVAIFGSMCLFLVLLCLSAFMAFVADSVSVNPSIYPGDYFDRLSQTNCWLLHSLTVSDSL